MKNSQNEIVVFLLELYKKNENFIQWASHSFLYLPSSLKRENENSKNLGKAEGIDLAIIVTENAFLV